MEDRVYNVALLGYGLSAKVFQVPWVPLIPQFNLYAIVQRHPAPDNDASIDHPEVQVYRSSEEMFKDENVDLVCIGTAAHNITTSVRRRFGQGRMVKFSYPRWETSIDGNACKVLCEKPFTISTKEANELIALAAEQQLLLSVFQSQ